MTDPRDPHAAERLAERKQRYHDAMRELDTDDQRYLTADARDACQLCDEHGYRGGVVCDHVDGAAIAKRGIAMVRAALTKGKP